MLSGQRARDKLSFGPPAQPAASVVQASNTRIRTDICARNELVRELTINVLFRRCRNTTAKPRIGFSAFVVFIDDSEVSALQQPNRSAGFERSIGNNDESGKKGRNGKPQKLCRLAATGERGLSFRDHVGATLALTPRHSAVSSSLRPFSASAGVFSSRACAAYRGSSGRNRLPGCLWAFPCTLATRQTEHR